MATNQGAIPIRGTGQTIGARVTFVITTNGTPMISGYVSPVTSGIQLTHQGSNDTVVDGDGAIIGVGTWGEYFEATFTLVPVGTTVALSRTNATLPALGSLVEISGADAIKVGSTTDVFNVTGNDRWIYLGGGTLSLTSTGQASLTLPLRRYPAIAMSNTDLSS